MIVEFKKVRDEVFHLQQHGQQRGHLIGFENLDKLYSVKAGTSTIIYGYPTSGKSQFLLQVMTSLASQGKKGMILSPETGTAAEIYAELIHCMTGKSFYPTLNYRITEAELYKVEPFIQDYFKVIEIEEKSITPKEFCEVTKEGIKDYGIFYSAFDNWNDLSHDFQIREDLYIEQAIPMFNRLARKEQIHVFGVWHAKNPTLNDKKPYPEAPSPFEIKGGSAIYSKAMNLICVHREYEQHGEGWRQTSSAQILVNKVKPKVVGQKGICKLDFDVYQNCYYENRGDRIYLPTPFKNVEKKEVERYEVINPKVPF
jgi:hypothetical protein